MVPINLYFISLYPIHFNIYYNVLVHSTYYNIPIVFQHTVATLGIEKAAKLFRYQV